MTDKLIKCPSCYGTKRVLGMGGFYSPCVLCKGVGWVDDVVIDEVTKEEVKTDSESLKDDALIVDKESAKEPVKEYKKRGRKPKIIQ